MAQIMDFLLNLLLLRKKLFSKAAAEKLHETIRKWLQFKRKILEEYKSATETIVPFENMLEFINFNSRHYRCEGENYVVTSEMYYRLSEPREDLNTNLKTNNSVSTETVNLNFNNTQEVFQNLNSVPLCVRHERKTRNMADQDHIVDNLNAIIRSQEFLFKNITKLVRILERDQILTKRNVKLENLRKKVTSCIDVLSNDNPQKNSIVNNLIHEEEVTRCMFRHGEGKTSAEISLEAPRPIGLAAALDYSRRDNSRRINTKSRKQENKISKEHVKAPKNKIEEPKMDEKDILKNHKSDLISAINEGTFVKRSKTDPAINRTLRTRKSRNLETVLKEISMDSADSKKLLAVSEQHFRKFEDTLWHTLTTTKFMSLRDDHLNMCKCAFYNKRHFMTTELAIMKMISKQKDIDELEKLVNVNNLVFQTVERKLLFEQIKQELQNTGQLPLVNEVPSKDESARKVANNADEVPSKEENKISKEVSASKVTNNSEETKRKSREEILLLKESDKTTAKKEEKDETAVLKSKPQIAPVETKQNFSPRTNQETNTIINSFKLMQHMADDDAKKNEENRKILVADDGIQNEVVTMDKPPNQFKILNKDFPTSPDSSQCKRKGKMFIKGDIPEQKMEIGNTENQKVILNVVRPIPSERFIKTDATHKETRVVVSEKNILVSNQKRKLENIQPVENMKTLKIAKEVKPSGESFQKKNANSKKDMELEQNVEQKISDNPEKNSNLLKKQSEVISSTEKQTESYKKRRDIWPSIIKEQCYNKKTSIRKANKTDDKSALAKIVEKHMNNSKPSKRIDLGFSSKVHFNIPSDKINFPSKKEKTKTDGVMSGSKDQTNNKSSQTVETEKTKPEKKKELFQKAKNEEISNRNKKMTTMHDVRKEATVIEKNEKAFAELETTIKNVKIFIDKTPSKKPILKLQNGSKQKMDDSTKKNMSTVRVSKQDLKRNSKRDETRKKLKSYSLSSEKTFLKKNSKELFFHKNETKKSKHSLAHSQNTLNEGKDKLNSQMRRTTKNAMKRLQVSTIFPKLVKVDGKKKPKISSVETEEIKTVKMNQSKRKMGSASAVHKSQTILNNASSKSIRRYSKSKPIITKSRSEKIHCVKWEEEEKAKFVQKFLK